MSFFNVLKTIFLLLIMINFAPPLIKNIKKQYQAYLEPKTQVGVLPIKGMIVDSSYYVKQLNTFFKDPEIKAILLKVECPGSAAATAQAIHHEIHMLKKEHPKHVEVLVENVCASGGYYIASAADHITAPGTAIIGSIGAYMPYLFQLKDFIEQFKIHYEPIKAGTYKSAGDPFVPMTPQERELLQEMTQDMYQQFVEDIAKTRGVSVADKEKWAEGKVFSARQAQKIGLVDTLGSLHTATASIKEKALIEGDIEWVYAPQPYNWTNIFKSEDDTQESLMSHVTNALCAQIETRYSNKVY
ncbi:MAG: signal peptide peptidase SppA [Candidatus Babeliales bacterium]